MLSRTLLGLVKDKSQTVIDYLRFPGVRVTHLPTGIVVKVNQEYEAASNLALAMQYLRARLYDIDGDHHEPELVRTYRVESDWNLE